MSFFRVSPWKLTVGFPGCIGGQHRAGIFALKTLQTGPRFEHGAIHGEMFVRHQAGLARLGDDRVEERTGDVGLQQAVPVLAEGRGRPDRFIQAQADEPSKQDAVVDLPDQQPLAPNRVTALAAAARAATARAESDGRPMSEYMRAKRGDNSCST